MTVKGDGHEKTEWMLLVGMTNRRACTFMINVKLNFSILELVSIIRNHSSPRVSVTSSSQPEKTGQPDGPYNQLSTNETTIFVYCFGIQTGRYSNTFSYTQ